MPFKRSLERQIRIAREEEGLNSAATEAALDEIVYPHTVTSVAHRKVREAILVKYPDKTSDFRYLMEQLYWNERLIY